ncbi:MAG: hypothetical protein ACRDJN_17950 [Chloroflexota bacterium]
MPLERLLDLLEEIERLYVEVVELAEEVDRLLGQLEGLVPDLRLGRHSSRDP